MHYDLSADTNEELRAALVPEKSDAVSDPRQGSALLYALLSAGMALVGVAGLFIGYFLRGAPLGRILAGGEPILRGALLGVMIEALRGSLAAPAIGSGLAGVLPRVLYLLVYVLMAAVVSSFALTAAAFLMPRSAKTFAFASGYFLLFSYGFLFFGVLCCAAASGKLRSEDLFDLPTLIPFFLLAMIFSATGVARRGGRAVSNGVFFLFSCFSLFAAAFPRTPLLESLDRAVSAPAAFESVLVLLLYAVLVLNFLLSVLRLNAGGRYAADMVRFGLQLFAVLAVSATYFSAEGGYFGFFLGQPLSAALLILLPLAGFLLAAFTAAACSVPRAKPRREKKTKASR